MPKSPEQQLEEFLASVPGWMRRTFETGFPSLSQEEIQEWFNNFDELQRQKHEYEQILQLIPSAWKEYRKRLKSEFQQSANFESQFHVPKGRPGRPLDPKAGEYFELHSDGLSYREIAERELKHEPDNEAKEQRIATESERIRIAIDRHRRRNEF